MSSTATETTTATTTLHARTMPHATSRAATPAECTATTSSYSTSTQPSKQHGIISTADYRERRRREHHEADIVIVGAGIVGCAAAVAFGRQGRSVILLEQSLKEPDRIVGELLQPGGVLALEKLGLRDCLEDIDAIPCQGYYITYHNEPVQIPYSSVLSSPHTGSTPSSTPTPEGRSFHHGRFIQKLRAAARATPNVTLVETKATSLVRAERTHQVLGVESLTQGKKDFYFGTLTLVADGYASKFRGEASLPHTPEVRSKFWGLELLDAELPAPHHGHVILSSTAPPILIYQIGTHETRILVDIPANLASAAPAVGGVKNHLSTVAMDSIPASIRPSFKAAIEAGKLRSMPNSFLPPATQNTPGLLVLGDALNMRHPLTGGGMTVAFNDVLLLADLLDPASVPNLEVLDLVQKRISLFHWRRKASSSVINVLAMALYALFAADDARLVTLQNGCFRYFQRGGMCVAEPVGLLAGLIRERWVLVWHFFAVALYAVMVKVREGPVWRVPWVLGVEVWLVLWKAVCVIGPYLLAEVRR